MADQPLITAEALIRHFEGFSALPYLCPAGKPTIGYGFTRYASGRRVTMKDLPMPRELADEYLGEVIRRETCEVLRRCPRVANPKRLAALVDFAYNFGGPNLETSTLRTRVNADDWPGACAQLARWVYSSGKVTSGLIRRRQAEIDLIMSTL